MPVFVSSEELSPMSCEIWDWERVGRTWLSGCRTTSIWQTLKIRKSYWSNEVADELMQRLGGTQPRQHKVLPWIQCNWSSNGRLPSMLRLNLVLALIRFVVPKLHIQGHTLKCQLLYSLNWVPGSGQVDGEGIERPWSMIGGVAASTRVSGPGACADLLDDHWSFWNWSKLVGLPKLLRRRLNTAIQELARQEESFKVFSEEQAEHVPRWKAMVEAFEADGNQLNPYEPTMSGLTESQVRERLDQEEADQVAAGCPMIHDISPSAFVVELLEVEAEQRRVSAMADLKRSNLTTMKINMRRLRRSLNKRIARLRTLQATYTPAALQHLSDLDLPQDTVAERVSLLPPSGLTTLQHSNGGLRNQLHVKYRLLLYKSTHSRNQSMNTRSRTLAAWRALVVIAGGRESAISWRRLEKDHIRCLEDSDELAKRERWQMAADARRVQREKDLIAAGIAPLVGVRADSSDATIS
ncbi:hypothetical protein C8F01DRAFT_1090059 [Mycena amicta]|nr:hypothetical protein C8F01DRAFT_1090059 [Mycena amicta]